MTWLWLNRTKKKQEEDSAFWHNGWTYTNVLNWFSIWLLNTNVAIRIAQQISQSIIYEQEAEVESSKNQSG